MLFITSQKNCSVDVRAHSMLNQKNMNISVVTVTQYSRKEALRLLMECILAQTKLPAEWVIVEGSPTQDMAALNAKAILQMQKDCPVPIIYLPYEEGSKLGAMRNRGNRAASGDLIVCMDDDDYYPPVRIQHIIEKFTQFPERNIAGCSNLLFYDYAKQALYQCIGFHGNHSTNSAMAFKSSYLATHQHEASKTFGEEASFTNGFSEPMIPLLPEATIVASCHSTNTYDKSTIFNNNPQYIRLPRKALFKIMPERLYQAYVRIFTL